MLSIFTNPIQHGLWNAPDLLPGHRSPLTQTLEPLSSLSDSLLPPAELGFFPAELRQLKALQLVFLFLRERHINAFCERPYQRPIWPPCLDLADA